MGLQEAQLEAGKSLRLIRIEAEFRAAEFMQIVLDPLRQALPIGLGRDDVRGGRGVETGKSTGQLTDFRLFDAPAAQQMVEHAFRRQPPHPHQPVHRLPFPAQAQAPFRIAHQRHHAEVDIGGQTTVEPHFLFAVQAPGLDRAEVQVGVAHRFFQLVGMGVGEEDPGHVGLHGFHP